MRNAYLTLINEIERDKNLIKKASIGDIQDVDPKTGIVWNQLQNKHLHLSVSSLIESLKPETIQARKYQKQDLMDFKEVLMQRDVWDQTSKNQPPVTKASTIETQHQYSNWTPQNQNIANTSTNQKNTVRGN